MEKTNLLLIILIILLSLTIGIIIGKAIEKTGQANPLTSSLSHLPAEKYLYDVEIERDRRAEGLSTKEILNECLALIRQSDEFQEELYKKNWLSEGSNATH